MDTDTTLKELQAAYDKIAKEELDLRNRINAMRRELTIVSKRRHRAAIEVNNELKRRGKT